MRRNEAQLLAWLADTCAFPVSAANMLVAASAMVSVQLELGVAATEVELLVPMTSLYLPLSPYISLYLPISPRSSSSCP